MKRFILIIVLVLLLGGCGAKGTELNAEEITTKLVESGLPIENVIIYTEKTDPNDLMGRPGNYYTSKTSFEDNRVEQYAGTDPEGGTVEVFKNNGDAKDRYDYVESVIKDAPLFKEYLFLDENVLLRVSFELTNDEANVYKDNLTKIINK